MSALSGAFPSAFPSAFTGSLPAVVPPRAAERNLSHRLDALAEIVKVSKAREGLDGFSPALIGDAEALLRRAGERLRLSGNHTVVALAGGTGSGKSTLFNALSGATFSPPGVTRPTTRHVHACVWGMQGAGPLLDWLGVQRRHRYARASALDSGEAALTGLLLLDLPDHDSVVTASMAAVDRLTKLADMLIFVLDPQKYADASVHRRYLVPLAGHSSVITVVLNQIDLLPPDQVSDCEQDLRRLLDAEGLQDTQVLPVSARTGAGIDDLRTVLTSAVAQQHSAADRISADIDSLAGGFAVHAKNQISPERAVATLFPNDPRYAADANGVAGGSGDGGAGATAQPREPAKAPWDAAGWDDAQPLPAPAVATRPPWEDARPEPAVGTATDPAAFVPDEPAAALVEALAQASGIMAVAEMMASASEARAAGFTGWPVARLATRRRYPAKGGPAAGAGSAQQSEVDNVITRFADFFGSQLAAPWNRSLRDAARSGAPQVPGVLAASIREGIPQRASVPAWWWLIAAWQWLLAALAVAGVAWSIVIAVGHGMRGASALLSDVSLIPWLLVMAAAVLVLGWLTAYGCRNMAAAAAEREQARAQQDMRERVTTVARDLVLAPVGRELAEYERFRHALGAAQFTRGGL